MCIFNVIILVINTLALIIIPICAVRIAHCLQREAHKNDLVIALDNQKRHEKYCLFVTLLSNRYVLDGPFYYEKMKALNSIDVIFYENQEVRNAWKKHFDVLADERGAKDNFESWRKKKDLTYLELLVEIAKILGYVLNLTELERGYTPQGFSNWINSLNMQNNPQGYEKCPLYIAHLAQSTQANNNANVNQAITQQDQSEKT